MKTARWQMEERARTERLRGMPTGEREQYYAEQNRKWLAGEKWMVKAGFPVRLRHALMRAELYTPKSVRDAVKSGRVRWVYNLGVKSLEILAAYFASKP